MAHPSPTTGRDRPAGTPSATSTATATVFAKVVAAAALFLLGQRFLLTNGVTAGAVVVLVLVPVWLPALRHYVGARLLAALGVLCLVSGAWLTEVAAADHSTSRANLIGTTVLVITIVGGVGVVLWAREVMPVRWVGLWFGLGMAAFEVTSDGRLSSNPWKFAYAIPVAVILLSAVNAPRWRFVQLGALFLLAGASALQDSRSYFATFLLAGLLFLWQLRPRFSGRRGSAAWTAVVGGALGLGVYQLGTTLLVDGYLGSEAQQRSEEQIDTSGSLLLGGRPELGATRALMEDRPYGFGSGVVPNLHDVLTAKTGMATLNYQPNNGYVETYMFGGQIKLHSVIGDLWSYFGIPGLVLAAVVAFLVVRSLAVTLATRTGSAALTFLISFTLWNLLFSPLFGSTPTLTLVLGLALLRRTPAEPPDEPDGTDGTGTAVPADRPGAVTTPVGAGR